MSVGSDKLRLLRQIPPVKFEEEMRGYSKSQVDRVLDTLAPLADEIESLQQQLADAYQLLGVSSDSSDSEIKRAYRKLMSRHHPDKLVAKGLPEEMMQMATQKTQDIKAAYEMIKASRA